MRNIYRRDNHREWYNVYLKELSNLKDKEMGVCPLYSTGMMNGNNEMKENG